MVNSTAGPTAEMDKSEGGKASGSSVELRAAVDISEHVNREPLNGATY